MPLKGDNQQPKNAKLAQAASSQSHPGPHRREGTSVACALEDAQDGCLQVIPSLKESSKSTPYPCRPE